MTTLEKDILNEVLKKFDRFDEEQEKLILFLSDHNFNAEKMMAQEKQRAYSQCYRCLRAAIRKIEEIEKESVR